MRFFKVLSLVALALTAVTASAESFTVLWVGQVMNLPECGGVLRTVVENGQANLKFESVRDCSNFDILSSNGEKTDYPNKKIPGPDGNRSGSFTLPKKVISYGSNWVTILVKSNSGKHADRVALHFYAR